MLQRLKKIFAFTMALTVLVSSHSFAYFEHLCTITNIKKISAHLETCAGNVLNADADTAIHFKKGSCCEIQYKINKADNAVQNHFHFDLASWVADLTPSYSFTFLDLELVAQKAQVHFYTNTSPPYAVPLYLRNQQFRI